MRTTMRLWAAALALLCTGASAAEPKPLFAAASAIHHTLHPPAVAFQQHGAQGDAAFPATVSAEGEAPLPVTLSLRGITRRQHDICQFPPLRITFAQKPPEASVFAGQKKLKLTTHCRAAADFQRFPLIEYATYRIYNLLTPLGFYARLAQIDYVDTKGKLVISRLGFLLEDEKDVARRNGLAEVKAPSRISPAALKPADAGRVAMFEYMIGNLDWAMTAGPAGTACCHNVKLLGGEGATTAFVPVPHDYDFSGLVDAPYATPPDGIPVANVRVRFYHGHCRYNAEAAIAAADMLARKAAILGVLDGLPQLDAAARRKAQAYLAGFFDQVAQGPGGVAKILRTCVN